MPDQEVEHQQGIIRRVIKDVIVIQDLEVIRRNTRKSLDMMRKKTNMRRTINIEVGMMVNIGIKNRRNTEKRRKRETGRRIDVGKCQVVQ